MLRIIVYITLFVALSGLSGCGQFEAGEAPRFNAPEFTPPADLMGPEFLQSFPILNEAGAAAAPADVLGAPFGVIVELPTESGQKGRFCTATHISRGRVLTNAHCAINYKTYGPEGYYIIFFDHDGKKQFTPVEKFAYIGDVDSDDVAVMIIPERAAENWNVAEGQVAALREDVRKVDVWSFDPFVQTSKDGKQSSQPGMRFHKRTCLASRAVPRLHGVRVPVVGPKRRKKLVSKKSNPDIHLFVDHCDSPLRSGNSGSLITLADEFRHQLGVYHWGISPKEEQISRYDYFEYLGNSGRLEFLRDITPQVDFFGVGFTLENLNSGHPDLLIP